MDDKDKLELLKVHVNDNYKVGSEQIINLQKLKEYVTNMSAMGIVIDNEGFNTLKQLINEHELTIQAKLPMNRLIQFVYNEGAKASAQQIMLEYREYIKGDKFEK